MNGVININKPSGMTSHDVVQQARRVLGEKRIGHTGTLDPLATGVLVLCIGNATRIARYLEAGEKEYAAVMRLGITTDTLDAEGRPVPRRACGRDAKVLWCYHAESAGVFRGKDLRRAVIQACAPGQDRAEQGKAGDGPRDQADGLRRPLCEPCGTMLEGRVYPVSLR